MCPLLFALITVLMCKIGNEGDETRRPGTRCDAPDRLTAHRGEEGGDHAQDIRDKGRWCWAKKSVRQEPVDIVDQGEHGDRHTGEPIAL